MKYDIFISYKRKTSLASASYLYELLLRKGYNVFFDKKEMRTGKFNEQILEHITDTTDIIILLEEGSLASWFDNRSLRKNKPVADKDPSDLFEKEAEFQEEPYKTDWFCIEVMHALSLKGKNVIPLLLNGYHMPEGKDLPPEMRDLSVLHAEQLDISELEEFYERVFVRKGFLKSRPENLSVARQFQSEGGIVGCFLFYTDVESCDLFDCGEKITTLTKNNDEWHPFRYQVCFAGEHRIKAVNNDSGEVVTVRSSVETYCQQYVQVSFTDTRNLWELTNEEIDGQDDVELLFRWGQFLFVGNTRHEPDITLSFECLKRAIDLGSQKALSFVSSCGSGLIADKHAPEDVAMKWYTIAAEQGNKDAQHVLGMAYIQGKGVEENGEMAIRWLTKAAEQGSADDQVYLGLLHEMGLYAEKDYGKAVEWYQKAAEQGDAAGQYHLGLMYYFGDGVEVDYGVALEWLTKSVEQGFPGGQYYLGCMYEEGKGAEVDYRKAIQWFTKAAELGHKSSAFRLGMIYGEGLDGKRDYGKAIAWYMKAAEYGDKMSLTQIARTYHLMGENDKALPWAEKAAAALSRNPYVLGTLAFVYEGLGRYEEALEQFEKSLQLSKQRGDDEDIRETEQKIEALKKKMTTGKEE